MVSYIQKKKKKNKPERERDGGGEKENKSSISALSKPGAHKPNDPVRQAPDHQQHQAHPRRHPLHLRLPRTDPSCPVDIATISDGHDDSGFAGAESIGSYLDVYRTHGSRTLFELIESGRRADKPYACVVYDPFMPWALDVVKRAGLIGAVYNQM
ncbi:UDP-glycosyltransferase 74F2 [Acorus calamus]|uniref:UDP-glycosyltransferase 74F2 n=1 Tax=Acorus calamus TaxID=4465 RepID=A0AAV9CG93_ACOCL|nr:UDP-glycosyltransferase 74F2 [Acorus calamus]